MSQFGFHGLCVSLNVQGSRLHGHVIGTSRSRCRTGLPKSRMLSKQQLRGFYVSITYDLRICPKLLFELSLQHVPSIVHAKGGAHIRVRHTWLPAQRQRWHRHSYCFGTYILPAMKVMRMLTILVTGMKTVTTEIFMMILFLKAVFLASSSH